MPLPERSPFAPESIDPTPPSASPLGSRRRWSEGRRRALWGLGRMLVVGGLFAWAVTPFSTLRPTAFAEPSQQEWMTPTPTPYGSWYQPGAFTPTPTPYGYGMPQIGEYINSGVPNQQTPYQPNPYQPNPYQPGMAPSGGISGSSVQPNGGMPGMMPGAASPGPNGTDPCYGDEQMTFAPEEPRVANEVLIAVSSTRPHPYGRLSGTERTQFVRERPGQLGYVWEWTVMLSYPGQHEYTFYVDSTIPCKKITLSVKEALATKTPKPTKTPTPYGWNENNNNGNNNTNNDNNGGGSPPYRDPYQFTYGGDAYNCSFFYSQGEAQRVLRANPADPNNLDSEDGVQDGIACTTYQGWQYAGDGDYNPVQRTNATQTTNFNPGQYLNQGNAYGCNTFASQANAQAVLRADPSDPNQLDWNPRNGIACEANEAMQDGIGFMPGPYDYNAVPR